MKFNQIKNSEDLKEYLKIYKSLYNSNTIINSLLKELTPHLSSTATNKERIYNILNSITEVPRCIYCQKPLPFLYTKYKDSYCDKFCHKSYRLVKFDEKCKDDPNWFKCEICGQWIKSVTSHLWNIKNCRKDDPHNIWTVEKYKESFPDAQILSISTRQRLSDMGKGQNNPNHSSKTTEEERKERSPYAIEFWRRKYPNKTEEEITTLWEEFHKDTLAKVTSGCTHTTTLEFYINNGYSKEDSEKLRSERQRTFTLEKCITKHGEEEGRRIYKERQDKWSKKIKLNFEKFGDGRSPSSKFANSMITSICNELNLEIPKKEKWISNGKLAYSYDFTLGKKIIEFNGDYWHMNPKVYSPDYFNKNTKFTAKEKWQKDDDKINLAKEKGYDVLVIWEKDFNDDKETQIQKCLQFLRQS